MENISHKYDDIINLPHHVSKKHPQMSLHDRAAQFSPFAALTGHKAAINETARLTDEKQILSEDVIAKLNEQLNLIKENIGTNPIVTITYFVPDDRKSGGAYISNTGVVKKRIQSHCCFDRQNSYSNRANKRNAKRYFQRNILMILQFVR